MPPDIRPAAQQPYVSEFDSLRALRCTSLRYFEAFTVTNSLPPVRRGFSFAAVPGGGLALLDSDRRKAAPPMAKLSLLQQPRLRSA